MFLWKAATILEEIRRHQPLLAKAMQRVDALMAAGAEPDLIEDSLQKGSLGVDRQWGDGAVGQRGDDSRGVWLVGCR